MGHLKNQLLLKKGKSQAVGEAKIRHLESSCSCRSHLSWVSKAAIILKVNAKANASSIDRKTARYDMHEIFDLSCSRERAIGFSLKGSPRTLGFLKGLLVTDTLS